MNEAKVTGKVICYVRSLPPASLTSEEDDFNQFHKIFHLITMSPFPKQSHVHTGRLVQGIVTRSPGWKCFFTVITS